MSSRPLTRARIGLIVATFVVGGLLAVALRIERVIGDAGRPWLTFDVDVPPAATAELDGDQIEAIWRGRLHDFHVVTSLATPRRPDATGVRVEVFGATVHDAPQVLAALTASTQLSIRAVADGLPAVSAWQYAVATGEITLDGVEVLPDAWADAQGREHFDAYVRAPSRDALDAAVAQLTARAPLPAGTSVVVEHVVPTAPDGEAPPPYYRTYVVHDEVILDNHDIAQAVVTADDYTAAPVIEVVLTPDGGRRFGDATAAHVGDKIAILVDDRVTAAPVLMGAIRRGRLSITMGAGGPADQLREAQALVGVLGAAHALPTGLDARFVGAHGRPLALVWALRGLAAVLAGGLAALLAALADRRRWFVVTPAVHPAVPTARWAAALIPAAVTVALPLALWLAAGRVLLPGINRVAFQEALGVGGSADLSTLGVLALGVWPAISAFILVEVVAVALEQLLPAWRGRRLGTPADRRHLDRAGWLLTLGLAALQAWFIAQYLETFDVHGDILSASRPLIVVTLVAGVMVQVIAAELISRHGLCNGYLALLAGAALTGVLRRGAAAMAAAPAPGLAHGAPAPLVELALIAAVALVVIATTRLRSVRDGVVGPRLPYAGAVPASLVRGSIGLIALPAIWLPWLAAHLARLTPWAPLFELGACVPLTALVLWSTPRAWTTAGVVASGAFVAALVAPLFLVAVSLRSFLPLADGVLLGLALAELHVGVQARARLGATVAVLVVHDAFAADDASDRLAAAAIPHALHGARARAALRLFGPLVPIELRVPAPHADAARAALAPTGAS